MLAPCSGILSNQIPLKLLISFRFPDSYSMSSHACTTLTAIILYVPPSLVSWSQRKANQTRSWAEKRHLLLSPTLLFARVKRHLFLSVLYMIINFWKLCKWLCYSRGFRESLIHPSDAWLLPRRHWGLPEEPQDYHTLFLMRESVCSVAIDTRH